MTRFMADDLNPRLVQAHAVESRTLNIPNAILPDAWLGMLGGGQLGRMFTYTAQAMDHRVCVLNSDPNSPTGTIAERHLCAGYTDEAVLAEMVALCPAVTIELENVPVQVLDRLEQLGALVVPRTNCVSITQNRIAEKRFFAPCAARMGIHPAPSWVIKHGVDIEQLPADPLPDTLKIVRMGYDGKGQACVSTIEELWAAWDAIQHVPCVLEKMLSLTYEVSVLAARGADGSTATWPPAENVHRDSILLSTIMPSRSVLDDIVTHTRAAVAMIAEETGYVGVLCIEFFVLQGGSLVVSEMAPCPHNSDHITMDACETSQFEQQMCVMTRLPLGDARQHPPGRMLNVLGDVWFEYGLERTPVWCEVMGHSGVKVRLYGRVDARPGRKTGHANCIGTFAGVVDEALRHAAYALGLQSE